VTPTRTARVCSAAVDEFDHSVAGDSLDPPEHAAIAVTPCDWPPHLALIVSLRRG